MPESPPVPDANPLSTSFPGTSQSIQSIPAYPARAFRVELGANMGDSLGVLDDLMLDDIYELAAGSEPLRLGLVAEGDGSFRVHSDTQLGTPGAQLHLDCALTLMPDSGPNVDALVMVEVDGDHMIAEIYLLPLAPLQVETGYRLVSANRDRARATLAQAACVAFSRGTHITMGTGEQRPIEDLRPGDKILTRDAGIQEVTWIGQTTTRAVGAMAPILIRANVLNNTRDLLVSPDHRLMVYQRHDALGAGSPELLVRAADLVNGTSVVVQDGGYVDYFQILFDRHHIIYAEGIAAESLLLDPVSRTALPEDVLTAITAQAAHGASHAPRAHHGLEVTESLLNRPDAVDILKRASLR